MTNKKCSKCGEVKPATSEHFNQEKSAPDGLQRWCKSCQSAAFREWQTANRAKRNEAQRRWATTPQGQAQDKRWRLANRDSLFQQKRAYRAKTLAYRSAKWQTYYAANKQRLHSNKRVYRAANPEKAKGWVRIASARRRAHEVNAEGMHTLNDIKAQYKAQKGKCYYCKKRVGDTYEVDHVVPISRGGSDGPENIVIACFACNRAKHDKLPHEWPKGGRLL
jgi:5-methylcytosine-specific restriction endonuclease McrA